jgi:hypothetical protein
VTSHHDGHGGIVVRSYSLNLMFHRRFAHFANRLRSYLVAGNVEACRWLQMLQRFGKARDHCPDTHPEKRRQVRPRKSATTGSPIVSSLADHPGLIRARLLSKPVGDKREKLKHMKGRKRSQATNIRYQGTAAASSYLSYLSHRRSGRAISSATFSKIG